MIKSERLIDLQETLNVRWLQFKRDAGPMGATEERLVKAAFFDGFFCGAEKQQSLYSEVIEKLLIAEKGTS